jgi:hypothetical protein
MALASCRSHRNQPQAPYLPLDQVEVSYGELITAGNHPTSDQNGTGERVGLFRDASGTVWGLPLTLAGDGAILGCAPPGLHDAKVTGTFPSGTTIIGATNQPTGWRGGTGKLELLLRDARGNTRWSVVNGGLLDAGPVCWVPEPPGRPQQLQYYRLIPAPGGNQ